MNNNCFTGVLDVILAQFIRANNYLRFDRAQTFLVGISTVLKQDYFAKALLDRKLSSL